MENQNKTEGWYYPSVQDMKASVTCNWKSLTVERLSAHLATEENGAKRSSVISYLQAAIKRKRKEAENEKS